MAFDICRRFVLHNEFIPPTDKTHNWDYFAFGYIDGISVTGENLFSNDKGDLECLWKDSVNAKAELVEQASRQVIYGFRTEDEAGREEAFWKDRGGKTTYPFLFFIMIQFEEEGRRNLSRLLKYKDGLEQKYDKSGWVKGITYLTLDNSDLILVLRSQRYEDGAKIVDSIHRKEPFYQNGDDIWIVKYSFTIPAVDRDYLNSSEYIEMQERKLYQAYIYVMELTAGRIQSFYEELREELKKELGVRQTDLQKKISKQSVLGYNDELIILSDIPWTMFLKLYRDERGILNHSNKKYQKFVSCLTTIIGFKQEIISGRKDSFLNGDTGATDVQLVFFTFLQDRLVEFVKKNEERTGCDSMFLSMYHLVNSLSKFERDSISENMFLPSAFSVYLLIEILLEIFEDKILFDVNKCYREYRKFLNGLNSYAQNPIRSDRQFTQVIELNIKTYNLPIKLNAFYNAFIFLVRDFLNGISLGNMHSYEFLTCPGVSLHMYVEELFEGSSLDKRLFLVNIPESQIYNLEQMMVMLCHEIGHFVGGHVRERSTRKDCLIKALARMITQHYRSSIGLLAGYDDFWQEFERKLDQEIQRKYEEFYSSEVIEKIYVKDGEQVTDEQHHKNAERVAEYRQQRRDHSIVMKEALLSAVVRVIKNDEDFLFRKVLYKCYMNQYRNSGRNRGAAEQERRQVAKKIVEVSKNLFQVGMESSDSITVKNMIEALIYLCREGLADIIAIMTLELEMEQYMKIILKNAREQGQSEELLDRKIGIVVIRISLVTACMVGEKEGRELGYGWKKDSILPKDADEGLKRLQHNVSLFINQYMRTGCHKSDSVSQNQYAYDYCCDANLLQEIQKYLLRCRESYAKLIAQKKEEQKNVWNVFSVSKADTIESALLQIENVIDDYRKQIQQKMSKIIIEGDENCVEIP